MSESTLKPFTGKLDDNTGRIEIVREKNKKQDSPEFVDIKI